MLQAVLTRLNVLRHSASSVCFDEASTISGHISGVQAKCKEPNNELVYVPCYAHCLNLVFVDVCLSRAENRMLLDFFGIL